MPCRQRYQDLPPGDFPIEILKVGIGWGSVFGGAPDSLEQAIHIYEGGLPNPGAPMFSLLGPVLVDGVINEFDLEPLPGEIIIDSGPFTVTLEFFNQNANDVFAPTVVHDGPVGATANSRRNTGAVPPTRR